MPLHSQRHEREVYSRASFLSRLGLKAGFVGGSCHQTKPELTASGHPMWPSLTNLEDIFRKQMLSIYTAKTGPLKINQKFLPH